MPEVLQLLGPSTGGIRQHVAWLTHALRVRGWSVRTAGPAGVLDGLVAQDAVVPVPRGRRALAAAVEGADLVHAHGLRAGWLASTLRVPVVVTVHNLVLDEVAGRSAPILRALEGWLPRRVDAVIAVSDEIGRRFGRAANVQVVPPIGPTPVVSVDRDTVRAGLGVRPGERLLVSVARLHPQKDLPSLLDAVATLERTRLVIFGEGPEEGALRDKIKAMGLEDVVVLAGSRPTVADEIAAADAFVVSSRWESGPLVLLEAMTLARPVVTTEVGFAPSIVRDKESGRIVPVGDSAALGAALRDVLDDPGDMGEAGRRAVEATFDSAALVDRIEGVYGEVLQR